MRIFWGIVLLIIGFTFFVNSIITCQESAYDELKSGRDDYHSIVAYITGRMLFSLLVLGVFTYFGFRLFRNPKPKMNDIEEAED
jgi:hypothetical protein